MRKESNNSRIKADDFIRYQAGNMTGQERNAFEKKLQKDPFADEAADGFSGYDTDEIRYDLAALDKKLGKRISGRKISPLIRIAAAITIIITISSVMYITLRTRSRDHELAIAGKLPSPPPENQTVPVTVTPDLPEISAAKPAHKSEKPAKKEQIPQQLPPELPAVKAVSSPARNIQEIVKPDIQAFRDLVEKDAVAVSPEDKAYKSSEKSFRSEGRIISSDDGKGLPGVSVMIRGTNNGTITDSNGDFSLSLPDSASHTLTASYIGMDTKEFNSTAGKPSVISLDPSTAALSEVVVTAMAKKREQLEEEETGRTYLAPRPSSGKQQFERYIRENLRQPDSTVSGKKAVVILSFLVRTDGSIDSLEIIKSPGKQYSDEAIRLIKHGPAWLPAESDGKITEEKARIRIVFRSGE